MTRRCSKFQSGRIWWPPSIPWWRVGIFRDGTDARSIGHRALAVNLSDLAAMGATPAWATLALTLPRAESGWLERFAAGLFDLADAHGVALVGGDTTRGPLTVSVQLLGHVPHGTALRRGGARAGDLLAVSGTLGDAGAGLQFSSAAPPAAPRARCRGTHSALRLSLPRGWSWRLAARGIATAAMDLSDGLVGDLPKLAQASGVARTCVRRAVAAFRRACARRRTREQARDWALAAGDDYELLFAVPPQRYAELQAAAHRLNLTLTAIGELRSGEGVSWSLERRAFCARRAEVSTTSPKPRPKSQFRPSHPSIL